MNKRLIKTLLCFGLVMLLTVAAGCDVDQWPFSLLREKAQDNLVLPEKIPDHEVSDDESGGYLFYYQDTEKRFLVPVTRKINYTEAIARLVTEELISNPELKKSLSSAGLMTPIPENTVLRGLNISEGLATVNFSASFVTYPEKEERLIFDSILNTLQQFQSIDKVMVTVEGIDISEFPGGTPGNIPLGPETWINLEISDELSDYRDYESVKIYFSYCSPGENIFYVPVTRVIKQTDQDPVEISIKELLAGPRRQSGLFSDIPVDTSLLNYSVNGEAVTVDLSEELLKFKGGRTGEQNIMNQLIFTLTDHPGIEKVKILIDGKEKILPGGTDLSQTFSRPAHINYVKF